jgi:two-component system, OmpR family, response regulator
MRITKVLMVDDEPDIRTIGELCLGASGAWEVLSTGSGSEALVLARQHRPDVILLDARMPGMDGPATLSKLKEDEATREIPVVFMTAQVQRHEVDRYMSLGAIGVISKPFDPVRLPEDVRELVAAHQRRIGCTPGKDLP